jgi:hypothetical protein
MRLKGSFDRPPVLVDPSMQSPNTNTKALGPINQRHGLAVVRQGFAVASVSRLLGLGCPAAVARIVVAVIVDAVYRVVRRWPCPHVLKECRETASPLLAHLYTSASVAVVCVILLVLASGNYRVPDGVLGRFAQSVSSAMLGRPHTNNFSLQASATTNGAVYKRSGRGNPPSSALAHTFPVCVTPFDAIGLLGLANDSQPTKGLASMIYSSLHAQSIRTMFVEIKET